MGQVWAAHRLGSPEDDLVALKTTLDHLADSEDFERVFVDEARIASLISHPNVCAIHEFGNDRGISYLAMHWVDGGTLHDILAATPTRRIDCHVAASIAASVCAGLHAAHELTDSDGNRLHVIHRDVSPQNILISLGGHVQIADFGIARSRGQSHTPTRTGELKGKLSYMAPEQLTKKEFDRRVDVFALGCVLYQATTGKRPFHGDATLETMYRLLEVDCERPSTLVPDYPMRLESIVLTALAKDVSRRYQTAAEFEDELLRFLAARGKLATQAEIATLVETTLGESLRQRAEQLEQAKRATLFAHAGSTSEVSNPASQRSRRHAWRWTTVGVAVLSMVTAASWVAIRPKKPHLTPMNVPGSALDTAPPNERVEIEITTNPPDGWLRLDDGTMVQSPWHLVTAPSPMPRTIVAGMAGYEETKQTLTFDRSARLQIRLQPIVSGRRVSPPPSSSLRGTASAVPSTDIPNVNPRTVESILPRARKPKRQLDPENPY